METIQSKWTGPGTGSTSTAASLVPNFQLPTKQPSEQEQVNGPTARYRHEICYYEGRIYVLGGGSSFEVQPLETLPAFDLETGTWNSVRTHPDASIPIEESYVEQYPRPRRCHSIEKCGHSKDHAPAVAYA